MGWHLKFVLRYHSFFKDVKEFPLQVNPIALRYTFKYSTICRPNQIYEFGVIPCQNIIFKTKSQAFIEVYRLPSFHGKYISVPWLILFTQKDIAYNEMDNVFQSRNESLALVNNFLETREQMTIPRSNIF